MSSPIHNHGQTGRNRIFNRVNRIVEGWYWLIPSHRLKREKTVAVTLMGRDLVAYRTREGNPVVMDAHCPHMGCHLSLGRVEENCLRCFFHNWSFGEDGQCVDSPSLEQPLPNVRVTTWQCRDRNGMIWVWTGSSAPLHGVPEPDDLMGGDYDFALGKSFRKKCHPNVVMINAIDEEHFRTVHHIPGHLLNMEPEVIDDHSIRFSNTAPKPMHSALFRFVSRFYQGPIRYRLRYWYGSNGIVTLGPDFLPCYIMFALRQTPEGSTEGQTLVFTPRRKGIHGRIFNRIVLWLTRIVGNYFSVGDTRVFQSIRFDYRTPVPADRAVQAFIRHLESQTVANWNAPPEES